MAYVPEDYVPQDIPYNDESYGGAGDYQSLWALYEQAEEEAENVRKSGYEVARWQTEYRKLVSVRTAELRADGTPATVTSDLVRGMEDVAEAHEKWLMAEADQKASNHLTYLKEQEAKVMEGIIRAEMYRPSNQ